MASLTPSPQSVEDTFRNHLLSMTLGVAQTQLLRVAAELGIADLVKDGPRSIEALATETGTEVSVLARVLRGLAVSRRNRNLGGTLELRMRPSDPFSRLIPTYRLKIVC